LSGTAGLYKTGPSLAGKTCYGLGGFVVSRVEFNVDGETILTAPIFSISVCPMTIAASA
jgi:hypothetical protein